MRIRRIGDTLAAIWVHEDGLGRKLTAVVDRPGAIYEREVAPGQWRGWPVPGSKKVVFTEVGQLVPFIKMMRKRENG